MSEQNKSIDHGDVFHGHAIAINRICASNSLIVEVAGDRRQKIRRSALQEVRAGELRIQTEPETGGCRMA